MKTPIVPLTIAFCLSITIAAASPQPPSPSFNPDPCLAYDWKQLSGVLRPEACDRPYDLQNYNCRNFARDACNEWRRNGVAAWKLGFMIDLQKLSEQSWRTCMRVLCPDLVPSVLGPKLKCYDEAQIAAIRKMVNCLTSHLSGHALNIVRLEDPSGRRAGLYSFAIIEPQAGEPGTATQYTWTQTTPYPVLPDDARKAILSIYKAPEVFHCPIKWKFLIVPCNEPLYGDPGYAPQSNSSNPANFY